MTETLQERNIAEQYGVVEHDEEIPVYTVDPSPMYPAFPEDSRNRKLKVQRYIDPRDAQNYVNLCVIMFRNTEQIYVNTFGYDTLPEALDHERYLRELLQDYTIHELLHAHDTHIQGLAKDLLEEVENTPLNTRAMETTEYRKRRRLALQRHVMRRVFEIYVLPFQNLDTPLGWGLSAINASMVQEQVLQNMRAQQIVDPDFEKYL